MAGQQGLVGLLGGREGMEHERGTEHGSGGPAAWQDGSGEELWMDLYTGVGLYGRENVGMWEYVLMCVSLCMHV